MTAIPYAWMVHLVECISYTRNCTFISNLTSKSHAGLIHSGVRWKVRLCTSHPVPTLVHKQGEPDVSSLPFSDHIQLSIKKVVAIIPEASTEPL